MFFSIIIPTFNREKIISNAIQSILAQTYIDYEIIIVDDGSVDQTEKLILSLNHEKIKYFKTENLGVAHARNIGIKNALGKYIGFLDSDDLMETIHLQTAFDFIQLKNQPEVLHLNFLWGHADKNKIHKNKLPPNLPDDLFKSCSLHVNCLFIRSDISKNNLFNEARELISAEDWDLFIKLAIRYKIHLLDKTTTYLIDHSDRSTRKINNNKWFKVKETFLKSLGEDPIIQQKYPNKIQLVDAHMRSLIALNFVLQNNKKQGILMWLKAIQLNASELFTKRSLAILKHLLIPFNA